MSSQKNGPRNTLIWTRDLLISNPMLYHWAYSCWSINFGWKVDFEPKQGGILRWRKRRILRFSIQIEIFSSPKSSENGEFSVFAVLICPPGGKNWCLWIEKNSAWIDRDFFLGGERFKGELLTHSKLFLFSRILVDGSGVVVWEWPVLEPVFHSSI